MESRHFSATGVSAVLVINCGSSSVKFALFAAGPTMRRLVSGTLDRIGLAEGRFRAKDSTGNVLFDEQPPLANHKVALALLVRAIKQQLAGRPLLAVARVTWRLIATARSPMEELEAAARLTRLRLHLPHNLGITAVRELQPDVPQVAASTRPSTTACPGCWLMTLPREFQDVNQRYGFMACRGEDVGCAPPRRCERRASALSSPISETALHVRAARLQR
jgi:acetate kinase